MDGPFGRVPPGPAPSQYAIILPSPRLCYIRGPQRILIGLAQELGQHPSRANANTGVNVQNYLQAAVGSWKHTGKAVTRIQLGDALLSDRWSPPKELGASVNDDAVQCSVWLGGRMRQLFVDRQLPKCDDEGFLQLGFAVTRLNDPTHGWYVEYADSDGYPMLWYGTVGHPIPDEATQTAFVQSLFNLLTSNPADVRDYKARHIYGRYGIRGGVPFFEEVD